MDKYAEASFGQLPVGTGEKPGIVVIDFADDDWSEVGFKRGTVQQFVSPKLLKGAGDE